MIFVDALLYQSSSSNLKMLVQAISESTIIRDTCVHAYVELLMATNCVHLIQPLFNGHYIRHFTESQ